MKTAHPLLRAARNVRSIFALRGCVDEVEAPELRRQLHRFAATTTGDVVVDCLELESIDAAGAGVLLAFHNSMLGFGRRVSVRRIPASCRLTFESSHLGGLLGDVDMSRRARVGEM